MKTRYPPQIYGNEVGSWAHTSVTKRLPEIADRVINENDYPSQVVDKLVQLRDGIPDQPIRFLKDSHAPDSAAWEEYLVDREGKKWLEVPWFFAEHYFYRRVMEAVDYFSQGHDPFSYQKEQGLIESREDTNHYALSLMDWINQGRVSDLEIRNGLLYSLKGNQADLSIWPAGNNIATKPGDHQIIEQYLLTDEIDLIIQVLRDKHLKLTRVDLLLDNAGFELICDLGLSDTLLTHHLVDEVVLHAKAHPTFVSDAIILDVQNTINFMKGSNKDETRALGDRLHTHLLKDRLKLMDHLFWNSPLAMWDMPNDLREIIIQADLLITKGDANYRRLLDDRKWDFTIPFSQVVDYLTVPIAALRTLKSELALDLNMDQIKEVYNQDPDWLVNGKWGVIQYSPGVASDINREHT